MHCFDVDFAVILTICNDCAMVGDLAMDEAMQLALESVLVRETIRDAGEEVEQRSALQHSALIEVVVERFWHLCDPGVVALSDLLGHIFPYQIVLAHYFS